MLVARFFIGALLTLVPTIVFAEQGWLGIEFNSKPNPVLGPGITIISQHPRGSAKAAGILPGDRLIKLDEKEIKSGDDAVKFFAASFAGQRVKVLIGRGDKQLVKTAILSPWHYRVCSYKGKIDEVIAACSRIIDSNDKTFGIAIAYGNRGNAQLDAGAVDKALDDFSEAIRLEPSLSEAFNSRALGWRDKGQFDRSIADYNEAIRLLPDYGLYYSNRGEVWRLKGDLTRALEDQNKGIEIATSDSDTIHVLRGDTYRYLGQFEHALTDYDFALTKNKDNIVALTGRGLTYERMGNQSKAKAEFENAVVIRSDFESEQYKPAIDTARARLTALNSGAVLPAISLPPANPHLASSLPTKIITPTSIPATVGLVNNAGRRVTLVIGNSTYTNVPALANPQKDSSAIAASLKNIGFEVVSLSNDLTREKMIDALRNFANEAEKADWAMVYYAGHGMEVGGVNYLIPTDAKIAVDRDIQFEAVPLNQVLNAADSAKKIKLIMLDACRDNPFTPRKTAAPEVIAAAASTAGAPITTRSSNGRGLAEVKVQGATLVVYAAKDGQVALDGEGGNSPFAIAVVQRLATPGVEINKIFRLVRDDVMEATAGRQEPYTYGSLPGKEDFFFVAK